MSIVDDFAGIGKHSRRAEKKKNRARRKRKKARKAKKRGDMVQYRMKTGAMRRNARQGERQTGKAVTAGLSAGGKLAASGAAMAAVPATGGTSAMLAAGAAPLGFV